MNEGILMRVLFCKIHCPFMCFYKPSNAHVYNSSDPLKLENTSPQHSVSSTVVSDADSESEDSSCSDVKEDSSLDVNEEEKTVVVLKSCVKKTHSESDVIKKKVSWMDVLGKELAEVKEFESSERYDYDGSNSCLCVIL